NAGVKTSIINMQSTLNSMGNNVKIDGQMGSNTLKAINNANPKKIFYSFKNTRIKYYNKIIKNNPSLKKFKDGWMNRINSIKYQK
ncbi:MAG: hypothetical protein KKH98_01275, partial [Spirochaetes bacterium]|nr:hypothetical protein [Spirochaetota bacterium]